ncbi:MAG: crotonase/enoyl-CoA hydratase family protein [Devosia nanyangense]|nr:crotonase/enoyl-CoA hydratase family protein [Devosia nanyangense]
MHALDSIPSPVDISIDGEIAILTLSRPEKRNALNDQTIEALGNFFEQPPKAVKVAILTGSGGHFSAGLDLSEHVARSAEETMAHSRGWHRVMDCIQLGGLPVVSALAGAVIGGGLEMAAATHVRIADRTDFFQLPEGRRGIFVGGGGSARIGRILGADRMVEMMLTGRTFSAEEGTALGLAHYLVEEGEAVARAREVAGQIATNAPLSNLMIIQALSRIQDMSQADGLFTESLATALAQSSQHAQEGLKAFLEKRAPRFK